MAGPHLLIGRAFRGPGRLHWHPTFSISCLFLLICEPGSLLHSHLLVIVYRALLLFSHWPKKFKNAGFTESFPVVCTDRSEFAVHLEDHFHSLSRSFSAFSRFPAINPTGSVWGVARRFASQHFLRRKAHHEPKWKSMCFSFSASRSTRASYQPFTLLFATPCVVSNPLFISAIFCSTTVLRNCRIKAIVRVKSSRSWEKPLSV